MFPFHEVTTADVPPVFRTTAIAERMQLVEEVIETFVIDRAVRIIDPLGGSRDVKNWARGISLGARCGGLNRSRRPGERIVHGFSTRTKRKEKQREQGLMTDSTHKAIVSGYAFRFKKAIGLAGRKVVI